MLYLLIGVVMAILFLIFIRWRDGELYPVDSEAAMFMIVPYPLVIPIWIIWEFLDWIKRKLNAY